LPDNATFSKLNSNIVFQHPQLTNFNSKHYLNYPKIPISRKWEWVPNCLLYHTHLNGIRKDNVLPSWAP